MIGHNEKIKLLDDAIHFDNGNIFEYINFLLFHRNANWNGEKADAIVEKIEQYLIEHNVEKRLQNDIIDFITEIATETSHYAYEAGFREGTRLFKTLLEL